MDEELVKALLKKATGYTYDEITEEYIVDEVGQPVLNKKKVTKKYCPPDSGALKAYLELVGESTVENMTDEELKKEKQRLLLELAEQTKEKRRTKK
jgi:hypothetical protein